MNEEITFMKTIGLRFCQVLEDLVKTIYSGQDIKGLFRGWA